MKEQRPYQVQAANVSEGDGGAQIGAADVHAARSMCSAHAEQSGQSLRTQSKAGVCMLHGVLGAQEPTSTWGRH